MAIIDNTENILDVRDIIERVEELREERDSLTEHLDECISAYEYHDSDNTKSTPEYDDMKEAEEAVKNWEDGEEAKELATLESLLADIRGCGGDHQWHGDWYPVTLIHENYFVEAMKVLVQDVGDLPRDIPDYIEIDWDATAENLRTDYSSVDFDGQEYWYR